MLKKLLSMVVCLSMLLSMVCIPSVSADASYAFKNVFVGEYTSTGTTLNIGWKNPVAETITSVTLYDITDGTETVVKNDFATTSGTVIEHSITGLTKGTPKTYKVKATFSDAAPVEYIVSGCPQSLGANIDTYLPGANSTTGEGFRIQLAKGFSIPPYVAEIDTTEKHSGTASFHIAVDRPTNGNYLQLMYYIDKTKLTANASHLQLQFYVKGNDLNGVMLLPKKNQGQWFAAKSGSVDYSDWTKKTWTASINATGWISFGFSETAEDFWIDDFAIYEVTTDGTVLTTNLAVDGGFETAEAAPAAVTNAAIEVTGTTAKLSWTDTAAACYNIYDANGKQIADLDGATDELYITGVDATKSLRYTIKPAATFGTEGAATIVSYEVPSYDFENVFAGEYTQEGTTLNIAWKNPANGNITKVALYDITDGNETLVSDAFATTNSLVIEHSITGLATKVAKTYKLKATFTDGSATEYIVSGYPQPSSKNIDFDIPGGEFFYRINKNHNIVPMTIKLDTTTGYNSSSSLYMAGGRTTPSGYSTLHYYYDKTGLATDSTLKLVFYAKAKNLTGVVLSPMTSGTYWINKTTVQSYNDWTKIEKNMKINSAGWIGISPTMTMEDLWIDNVALYEVKSDGTVGTTNLIKGGDFETAEAAPAAVTNAEATFVGNGYKLSWTDTAAAGYNVYDAKGNVVAYLDGATDEVYLTNAADNATYTIKPFATFGTEGNGVTVKCVKPPYQLSNVTLSCGEKLVAGEATVSVNVTNNTVTDGMDVELLVVLFNGDNFADVELIANSNIAQNSTKTLTSTITIPALDSGVYTLKALLWNPKDTIKPYCKPVVFGE